MTSKLITQYPEMKRLERRINRSKGEFSLFFVECNLPTLREDLANDLSRCLELPAIQFTLPPFTGEMIQFDQIIAEYVKDKPLESSIFLFGLESWLPTLSKETLHQTVQQLNWRRSSFARLKRPLVIWVPKYALDILAEYTPDFFDWYSGIFVIKAKKSEQDDAVLSSLKTLNSNFQVGASSYLSERETRNWLHTINASLLERQDEDQSRGKLLNEAGLLYLKLGDKDRAMECLQQSLIINRRLGNKAGEGLTLNNIAQIYDAQGDFSSALEYLEKSLSIQQEAGNKLGEGSVLNNIATAAYDHGEHDLALDYYRKSLLIMKGAGEESCEARTLSNISQYYQDKGDLDTALEYLNESLDLTQKIGDKLGESIALNNIATVSNDKGEHHTALEYFMRSLSISQEIGDKAGEGVTLDNISSVYLSLGDYDAGLKSLQESMAIKEEIGDKSGLDRLLLNLGTIYYEKGETEKAISFWLTAYLTAKERKNIEVLDVMETIASKVGLESGLGGWERLAKKQH